ncbi:hypothetical protein KM043_003196 [Ampulex compressa]|nr:hypothetical protein KM043_003196 [Ampulex compressa]
MPLVKVVLFLNFIRLALTGEDPVTCAKGRTILETPGEAVISVFIDANDGPDCNLTSTKGYQEISTASFVVQTLNKHDYVPGFSLGLKVFDTCHNEVKVYKQALRLAVELDCAQHYDLGILAPWTYSAVLEPLRNYSLLPVNLYEEQNLTRPLIGLMVHYLSTRFETVDLVLTDSESVMSHFLRFTREAGICVRGHSSVEELEKNMEAVIAVIGERDDIQRWVARGEKLEGPRKTWVVLPLDGSHVDDLVPPGSYVIKSETFDSELGEDETLRDHPGSNSVIHSPYLLGIGKAIVELAQVLQDLQRRSCTDDAACVMPRFNPRLRQEIRNADVYDALHVLPKSHSMKYVVGMKSQEELVEVAVYKVEAARFRVVPEKRVPRMPRLCLRKYAKNCEGCSNFRDGDVSGNLTEGETSNGLLKVGNWTPIFLTIVVCGTFACGVIAAFILYRFFVEEILDGNPTLTIILILANVFALQTVLPFCINDDYFGAENLNSRKIFVTTLAFGTIFSVMLSRSFFLAFSRGGVFTGHVNGYLQCLMVFFVLGVQVAISTMYFFFGPANSADVVRSLFFIALLGYDIFLLLTVFTVCCFISQVPRNYHEGKCFFGTSIGLLIAWAVWLTCFVLMEPKDRDIVVCFGVISTAYLIIAGILIPRTYYMMTHLSRGKQFGQGLDPMDMGPDPRMNAMVRQARPFYDYIHTGAGGSMNNLQVAAAYPNYYGSSSPNPKYIERCRSPDPQQIPGYNNYGFHSEMREINHSYIVPRVCIEDTEQRASPLERSNVDARYARPKCARKKKMILEERDCIETDVYVEGSLSPSRRPRDELYPSRCSSPRLGQTEATIREESEEENVSRITRF